MQPTLTWRGSIALLLLQSVWNAVTAKKGRLFNEEDGAFHKYYGSDQEAGESIFQFGTPAFAGSGCPNNNTVLITDVEDGSTVSILFEEYFAETIDATTKASTSCNLAFPVAVAAGYSVGIVQVDFRGYVYVPDESGAKATFSASYSFAGSKSKTSKVEWESAIEEDFFLQDNVGTNVWSQCQYGEDVFQLETAISAKKKKSESEDVMIEIQSGDMINFGRTHPTREFRFLVKQKRCGDEIEKKGRRQSRDKSQSSSTSVNSIKKERGSNLRTAEKRSSSSKKRQNL